MKKNTTLLLIQLCTICAAVTFAFSGQAIAAAEASDVERCADQALNLAKLNLDQKAVSEYLPGARLKAHSLLLRPSPVGTQKYLVVGFVGHETYNVVVEMDSLCGANLISIQQVL